MIRFFNELKYSIGLKRHLFFIILIAFIVGGTSWLFQDSLKAELQKAFPGRYNVQSTEEHTLRLQGEVTQKSPQVSNADLKAELMLNAELRKADWITEYVEYAQEYVQVASFLGPESAIKGYQTDSYFENKDVEANGSKYTTVNTVWLEQSLAEKFNLGNEAIQMFNMPNDYLQKVYVVLGAEYRNEDGYRVGNILKVKNDVGSFQMQVIGFLESKATVEVGGKTIELDSAIVCPFISLQDVYEVKEEVPESYTDGAYIPTSLINTDVVDAYRNNPANKKNDSKTGIQYAEVKALYIVRSAVTEDSPTWLKTLANIGENEAFTRVMVGANYGKSGLIVAGTEFNLYNGTGLTKLQSFGTLDPGTTFRVYGMDINLDDYIVFLQPEKKVEEVPQPKANQEDDDEVILIDEPIGPREREFKVEERAKLFHYQVLMNRGYFTTSLTADEAQEKLEEVVTIAWRDFNRDNPKSEPLSNYRVSGADQSNSILFRANADSLANKVLKFTKTMFPICMFIFALFLFFKFYKGREFYTALYLTGTNRIEMMALYLIEGLLMIVLSVAGSAACAYVICKLLQLEIGSPKPLIGRFCRLAGFPTVAIMVFIGIRDFGRMFRRKQEV